MELEQRNPFEKDFHLEVTAGTGQTHWQCIYGEATYESIGSITNGKYKERKGQ